MAQACAHQIERRCKAWGGGCGSVHDSPAPPPAAHHPHTQQAAAQAVLAARLSATAMPLESRRARPPASAAASALPPHPPSPPRVARMELGPGQRRAALARLPAAWCTWVARPALRLEFAVETNGHVSGSPTRPHATLGASCGQRQPGAHSLAASRQRTDVLFCRSRDDQLGTPACGPQRSGGSAAHRAPRHRLEAQRLHQHACIACMHTTQTCAIGSSSGGNVRGDQAMLSCCLPNRRCKQQRWCTAPNAPAAAQRCVHAF